LITQYYTDYAYSPVLGICQASTTGHGTNVIAGVAVGLESTGFAVLVMCCSILGSFYLGQTSGISNSAGTVHGGIFGTAVATLGMLSTAVFILAMDVFGPIADNAGGIVEMSHQPEAVRDITDRLDAVGNVTKANTKGYAIGSAALACFLLFSAFMDEVSSFSGLKFKTVDIAIPEVFVGGLLGSCVVMVFSSYSIAAVGNAAQEVVKEVRRQFKDRPEIMSGAQLPDYRSCVGIVAARAIREMVRPGALAVFSPMIVATVFRWIGTKTGNPLLGPMVLTSFVMFATTTGILMGIFFNNSGAAWDNAKKFLETGAYGGKGSETHKATVTGDTVGDPFKDTAGPSLHVLIKLLSTMSLVMAPFLVTRTMEYKHVGGDGMQ
jgi:H(+)-translocating pyrophosphatase